MAGHSQKSDSSQIEDALLKDWLVLVLILAAWKKGELQFGCWQKFPFFFWSTFNLFIGAL
jgi:hypothetical protein